MFHASIQQIFCGILYFYNYNLHPQSLQKLRPLDACIRESFAEGSMAKDKNEPQWLFNSLWIDKAHFTANEYLIQYTRVWTGYNPNEYTMKSLNLTKLSLLRLYLIFDLRILLLWRTVLHSEKNCTITVEHYPSLLHLINMPPLSRRIALSIIKFI